MNDSIPVLIIGTGGFAVELFDVVRSAGVQVEGFVGPDEGLALPAPLLGDDETSRAPSHAVALVAVGDPGIRRRVVERHRILGTPFGRFVHPSAMVTESVKIGEGVIVYPNSTVHARVDLQAFSFVNSNVSVGHESRIGAFSTISPGCALGGRLDIGEGVYLGIGAQILPNLSIASDTMIGGGATVTRSITTAGTYVGTPAKQIGVR